MGLRFLRRGSICLEDTGMTDKELKRLSRAELMELLLVQTREAERLREKLDKTESMLGSRYVRFVTVGDLAHAVLEVNGVMEAAQAAAKQYLDNIVLLEAETKEKCEKMLEEAREEAAQIRRNALLEKASPDEDEE